MFVKFKLRTNRFGTEKDPIYHLPDSISENRLRTFAHELARNNAGVYGISTEDKDETFWGTFKIIENKTKDDLIKKYGEVLSLEELMEVVPI